MANLVKMWHVWVKRRILSNPTNVVGIVPSSTAFMQKSRYTWDLMVFKIYLWRVHSKNETETAEGPVI